MDTELLKHIAAWCILALVAFLGFFLDIPNDRGRRWLSLSTAKVRFTFVLCLFGLSVAFFGTLIAIAWSLCVVTGTPFNWS